MPVPGPMAMMGVSTEGRRMLPAEKLMGTREPVRRQDRKNYEGRGWAPRT